MKNDVGETTNLHTAHPEIVERLLKQLKADVFGGRSTRGPQSKNDVDEIDLWKSK